MKEIFILIFCAAMSVSVGQAQPQNKTIWRGKQLCDVATGVIINIAEGSVKIQNEVFKSWRAYSYKGNDINRFRIGDRVQAYFCDPGGNIQWMKKAGK
jgi:hypothetical protein